MDKEELRRMVKREMAKHEEEIVEKPYRFRRTAKKDAAANAKEGAEEKPGPALSPS